LRRQKERIRKLEDKTTKIITSGEQKEKLRRTWIKSKQLLSHYKGQECIVKVVEREEKGDRKIKGKKEWPTSPQIWWKKWIY
jgi:hypothetical protein